MTFKSLIHVAFALTAILHFSMTFADAKADPSSDTNCEDRHSPSCFFEKQTVETDSGSFSYARHNGLFLTGALNLEQLATLQELGVVAVIDIRQTNEDRTILKNAAESLGLVYTNTPLFEEGSKNIRLESVRDITAFHRTYRSTPHVVACSSGNRSSAWFGAHQFLDHQLSSDAAIDAAREAFLRDDMADALRRFFDAQL